eukprot:1161350-Pelagomonas_calceolata.AAC.14
MDTMRIGTPEYMGPELISSRWAVLALHVRVCVRVRACARLPSAPGCTSPSSAIGSLMERTRSHVCTGGG